MSFTYYHNPRCSKSRQGLALLEENNVDFQVREYLKEPLNLGELKELFGKLPVEAGKALRTKEAAYKEAGLNKDSSETEIHKAVAASPILLERPILEGPKQAIIGRPPEDLLKII